MNMQTTAGLLRIAGDLRRTIAGKEMLLATYENPSVNPYAEIVKATMIQMLEINIDELKRILQDLEQCIGAEQ